MKKLFTMIAVVAISLFVFIACETQSEKYGNHNGHEYVDLGLSVKWATCNVGASIPEEYGDYFAWGEVETKERYWWDTYEYFDRPNFTKYTGRDKVVLDMEDDVARINWGGAWRMPTKAEQAELVNNCIWTWTTQKGVNGYKVTGVNNNSIFLPAAGIMAYDSLALIGRGMYWSVSLYTDSLNGACASYLFFNLDGVCCAFYPRNLGLSVRPVCQ